ncbi:alpha/beta hydrolase [Solwaraspora sp. WMMD406]|uniref:alpha/beta fold hydrolase n=1 Tax=Solwaraspora sp. WMMD406 TaxID=3016095 RepID=UPI002416DFF6|nr:alpha/beta hydrolase [Solwaraspora sp. WMMD406]MDG4766914.1 alpha/beta hydrolase [Solwaraspora sp. WMMD406]
MATYVLIHGAGSDSWYWHLVIPRLRGRGHEVIAPDLPCEDDSAGLSAYVDLVVEAIGDRRDVVVVAQSLAGFTAPVVCQRVPVDLLVLVAAMVPAPGETAGDWWGNTGVEQARRAADVAAGRDPDAPFDPLSVFLHDLPPDVLDEALRHPPKEESAAFFKEPWPLTAWPDVPTRFLLCRDDRFFPADFQRRVVAERLGITPDEIDGGHLPALSRASDLVECLERFRTESVR